MEAPVPNTAEDHGSAGFSTLFMNRQFMMLWFAQILSQFADRAVFVLFVAVLTEAQKTSVRFADAGPSALTSFLYVAFTIPAIVLSPIAGVYVDRWSQKWVMVLSNLLRGLFVGLVALPMVAEHVWMCFGLAFLSSVSTQFFGPAETSSIPRLVSKNELYAANSLFFTTMMIALGFGFAIGEPIISKFGVGNAPWAVAAFFAGASFLLLFIKDHKNRNGATTEAWWEELRFGLQYISGNEIVFKAIMKITFLFSTIITLNIIAVGLADQVLHIEPFKFGYIVAAAGIGMGIGNFWVGHYGQKLSSSRLVDTGFTLLGLFMSLMGGLGYIQKFLWPAIGRPDLSWHGAWMLVPLALAALIGASCALVVVPTQAALQSVVPEELRGKVFGAQNTAMSAASTIPAVLAGALIDNLPGGVSTTLFLIGIPTLMTGIFHLVKGYAPSES